jgi:predicted nucleic acid-binding protein
MRNSPEILQMQDLVMSDTSCLILLSKIDRLELFRVIYGVVLIPPEVQAEYEVAYGRHLPDWINILRPSNESISKFQLPGLDRSEQAAFALASEHPGALLIVDDERARKIAKCLGFRFTGTIGVLLVAKELGKIPSIRPLLIQIQQTDFYLSEEIVKKTLRDANESDYTEE